MNALKSLAAYYKQSPDKLTNEQIQDYLHYIIADRKLAWSTCNVQFSGIKRFYKGKIDLPVFPGIVKEIQEYLGGDSPSIEDLVTIVEMLLL